MKLYKLKSKEIEQNPIINILNRLWFKNQNWLGVICGATGSGKSYAALQLCLMIDSDFNENKIVLSSSDFFKLLNNNELKKGNAILFDEIGVSASSRNWYSVENKQLAYILQTFRAMNIAVIFTTPNLEFIDKIPQKLIHAYIETGYIDYTNKKSYLNFYNVQNMPRFNKTYNRFSVIGNIKASTIILKKPPQWLIEAYEHKKRQFIQEINKTAQEKLELAELKDQGKNKISNKSLNQIAEKIIYDNGKDILAINLKNLKLQIIREVYGLSMKEAKEIKTILEYLQEIEIKKYS